MSIENAAASFAIMITANPVSEQGGLSALHFARAAVAAGHRVRCLFFSGAGVLHGNRVLLPAADEMDLRAQWQNFAREHGAELLLCSSAAMKYGVLDSIEAQRQGLPATLAEAYVIAGLGSWVEASLQVDRCLHFAGHSA